MASPWSGKVQARKISANGLQPIVVMRFTNSGTPEVLDFDVPVPGSIKNQADLTSWALTQRASIITQLDKRDAMLAIIDANIGS